MFALPVTTALRVPGLVFQRAPRDRCPDRPGSGPDSRNRERWGASTFLGLWSPDRAYAHHSRGAPPMRSIGGVGFHLRPRPGGPWWGKLDGRVTHLLGEKLFAWRRSRQGTKEERSTVRSPVVPVLMPASPRERAAHPRPSNMSALGATGSQPERAHRTTEVGAKGMPKVRLRRAGVGSLQAGRSDRQSLPPSHSTHPFLPLLPSHPHPHTHPHPSPHSCPQSGRK